MKKHCASNAATLSFRLSSFENKILKNISVNQAAVERLFSRHNRIYCLFVLPYRLMWPENVFLFASKKKLWKKEATLLMPMIWNLLPINNYLVFLLYRIRQKKELCFKVLNNNNNNYNNHSAKSQNKSKRKFSFIHRQIFMQNKK